MTYGTQILIKPLKITLFPKEKELVGVADVILRKSLKTKKALIYKTVDNVFNTAGELYRLVINDKHIIGYTLLIRHNNVWNIPILSSTNLNYKVGKILSAIAVNRFLQSGSDFLTLTAGWNSLLHHRNMGFQILPQHDVNGKKADEIIASGDMEQIKQLDSITMCLQPQSVAKILKRQPLIKFDKLFKNKGEVGRVANYVVYKKTHKTRFEEYQLIKENKPVGSIYLNYYDSRDGVYKNCYGEIPDWSPLYHYGNETKVNKIFAEYWTVNAENAEEEELILNMLVQIALEVGKSKNCEQLQIEADWSERLPMYKIGFRTQDVVFKKSVEEINEIINKEAKNPQTANLNKIGSINMVLTRENAIKYGWKSVNILK